MEIKTIQIGSELHRELAIRSAMSGESIRSITEKAIKRELLRIEKTSRTKERKVPHAG